jgi:hypothetical protein
MESGNVIKLAGAFSKISIRKFQFRNMVRGRMEYRGTG